MRPLLPRVAGGPVLVLIWACGGAPAPADLKPEPPPGGPVPEAVGPAPVAPQPEFPVLPPGRNPPDTVVSYLDVRVGLHVGAGRTDIGGGDALIVANPAGQELSRLEEGSWSQVTVAGQLVGLVSAEGTSLLAVDMLVFRPSVPGRFVRVAGLDYRGEVWVFRDRTGLTIVNRLGIESYLAGVVPLEIGSRQPEEIEAVKAQAIVSRTFAVRNMGRWQTDGFDFRPTVADQVYGGVKAEQPLAWQAVRATRGTIITYNRVPIDAFFASTCGGETAEGTEVFSNARRSYLISIRDVDASGRAYCRISPWFRWRETWSGDQVAQTLRRTLPAQTGTDAQNLGALENVRVVDRTGSHRVARLAVEFEQRTITVDGPAIRRVLLRPDGGILRSNAFSLDVRREGGRVAQIVGYGAGAGHGVGLCQWGTIGRARAGLGHSQILASYFPGTTLEQLQ